ncbi:uncharacterized protein LOC133525238 isoform X2 [Cydia pomonella]|uniref:uncharacterized protein LOC133525238 isoform X2 n=1 Tax=Cydia pomonella TaxID=82600 RepID=UPI002ADE65D1|nr:uncharacterized protein LOC133525238 isoform X2 [Cydia pomonella]
MTLRRHDVYQFTRSNMERPRTPFPSQSGTYKIKNMFGSSQPPRLPSASKEETHMYMCFGKTKAPLVQVINCRCCTRIDRLFSPGTRQGIQRKQQEQFCTCWPWTKRSADAERRPLLQESETAEYPHSPPEQRRSLRASQLRLYKMLLLPEQPQQPLNPPELLAAQQRWRSAVAAAQQHRRFIGEIGP